MYIGSTEDFLTRIKRHKKELKLKIHHNIYLQNSYNKYGKNAFKYIIYRFCDKKDLRKLEKYYIEKYNPEYNIGRVGGGDCIKNHPNKTQIYKKMSIDRMGSKNSNWRGGHSSYYCIVCNQKKKTYSQRTICVKCCKKP